MKGSTILGQKSIMLIALLVLFGLFSHTALAQSTIQLNGSGVIAVSPQGPSRFSFSGTASDIGKYKCHGEILLSPGEIQGSQNGSGVAVFKAADGDLLVGVVTLDTDANGDGQITFSWRDSVQFSDGTVVSSTGRFVDSRPPGAKSKVKIKKPLIIIIAILIG